MDTLTMDNAIKEIEEKLLPLSQEIIENLPPIYSGGIFGETKVRLGNMRNFLGAFNEKATPIVNDICSKYSIQEENSNVFEEKVRQLINDIIANIKI